MCGGEFGVLLLLMCWLVGVLDSIVVFLGIVLLFMVFSFFVLFDDIVMLLDDVVIMIKVVVFKMVGVLGDDLVLNVE